jgi:MFS family permease
MTKLSRVALSVSVGAMIQVYNFVIYIFFAPLLAHIFYGKDDFHALLMIYIIFALGYFMRPVGGLLVGKIGKVFGMKSTCLMPIMLMGFATVFIGSLPSSITLGVVAPFFLLFFRLLQGVAFGGELPASVIFVFEHLPEKQKLLGTAFITAGVGLGLLLATCVTFIFTYSFTYEELLIWGWRPPFFTGAILAAVGFYVKYLLTDTPYFEKEYDAVNEVKRLPFIGMVKNYKNEVIVSFLINVGLGVYVSVFCIFMPSILSEMYGFKLSFAYGCSVCFLLIYVVFSVIVGYFAKRYRLPPRILFITGSICVMFFTFLLILGLLSNSLTLVFTFYILIGFSLALCCSMLPFLLATIFNSKARYTGIAFSYNVAQAVGSGCTPIIIIFIILFGSRQYSISVLILVATFIIVIGFILGLLLKDENGERVLNKPTL